MTGARYPRTLSFMVERSEMLRLVLEVERDVEPIRGTVAHSASPARPYVGWVALIATLDELRGTRPEEAPCPDG